jgi:hypothetical protein
LEEALNNVVGGRFGSVTISFPNSRNLIPARWMFGLEYGLRLLRYTLRFPAQQYGSDEIDEIPSSEEEVSSDEELHGRYGLICESSATVGARRLRHNPQQNREENQPRGRRRTDRSSSIPLWETMLRENVVRADHPTGKSDHDRSPHKQILLTKHPCWSRSNQPTVTERLSA